MPKPPVLKPLEMIRILKKLGFIESRQKGSHKRFQHFDGRSCTVPVHKGRDLSPGVIRQIASQLGLTVDELVAG